MSDKAIAAAGVVSSSVGTGEIIGAAMIVMLFVGMFVIPAMNDLKGAIWAFAATVTISTWIMGACYLMTGGN
jgi:hypothetical protein